MVVENPQIGEKSVSRVQKKRQQQTGKEDPENDYRGCAHGWSPVTGYIPTNILAPAVRGRSRRTLSRGVWWQNGPTRVLLFDNSIIRPSASDRYHRFSHNCFFQCSQDLVETGQFRLEFNERDALTVEETP
jgi:hypothetical protein